MNSTLFTVKTLTKKDLLKILEGVDDDSKIYVVATKSVIEMAQKGALVEPHDVYLSLSNNVQKEANGIALVADFN